MDQADGYASLMLEIKKKQEEENKGNTQPTGRKEMMLCLCCTKFCNEKSNFSEHSCESEADSSSEGAVEIGTEYGIV